MFKRLAAIAIFSIAGGLSLAGPALAGSAVVPGVTFTGSGPGLLLCGSKPDPVKMTVAAESKVRLTNDLGMAAQLNINGAAIAQVANREAVEVQFHRGPVSITMIPNCALNLNPIFEQLTVEVTAPVRLGAARPLVPDELGSVPPGGEPGPGGVTLQPSATVVSSDGSPAQKVASGGGQIDKGPIGLLGIIATVCVVGVLAGAIRAIITQWANRARFA